jgi:hypothetical protein
LLTLFGWALKANQNALGRPGNNLKLFEIVLCVDIEPFSVDEQVVGLKLG